MGQRDLATLRWDTPTKYIRFNAAQWRRRRRCRARWTRGSTADTTSWNHTDTDRISCVDIVRRVINVPRKIPPHPRRSQYNLISRPNRCCRPSAERMGRRCKFIKTMAWYSLTAKTTQPPFAGARKLAKIQEMVDHSDCHCWSCCVPCSGPSSWIYNSF